MLTLANVNLKEKLQEIRSYAKKQAFATSIHEAEFIEASINETCDEIEASIVAKEGE